MNQTTLESRICSLLRECAPHYLGFKSGKYLFSDENTTNPQKAVDKVKSDLALAIGADPLIVDKRKALSDIQTIALAMRKIQPPQGPETVIATTGLWDDKRAEADLDYIRSLKPIRAINTPPVGYGQIVLYDEQADIILKEDELDIQFWCAVNRVTYKSLLERTDYDSAYFSFDPRNHERAIVGSSLKTQKNKIMNLANRPKWMKKSVTPQFTGFIKSLFHHLFPLREEREKVLDWFHYALTSRAETVLVLCGARGTGKSTIIDILGHIVGKDYYETLSDAPLKDKFNSQFFNKRLLKFEEVGFTTQDEISKIKAWCNSTISYESKGQDARTVENHASLVFLLNNMNQIRITPSERRFSVPEIANAKLEKSISSESINEFILSMKEETDGFLTQLAEFGYWLMQRTPKSHKHSAIRGKAFWRISSLGLKEWEQMLIEYITKWGKPDEFIHVSQIFSLKDNKVHYGDIVVEGVPRKLVNYKSFFDDYLWRGEIPVARVVQEPEGYREEQRLQSSKMGKQFVRGAEKGPGKFQATSSRTFGFIPNEEFLKAYKEDALEYKDLLAISQDADEDTAGEDLL